jgi:hypothetical protein
VIEGLASAVWFGAGDEISPLELGLTNSALIVEPGLLHLDVTLFLSLNNILVLRGSSISSILLCLS